MALLPLGVSSVWGGRVPPSRARYNAIDTHGNREGQNVSSVSPCDLRKKLQRRQVCRRPLPPPRTPHATGCAAGRVRGECRVGPRGMPEPIGPLSAEQRRSLSP